MAVSDGIGFNIPWFIFDLRNFQLITSNTIPSSDISDSKPIVLAETPIPGLNFNPLQDGGRGNRKIGFTIPLVKRDGLTGNILLVKQFENLRNQPFKLKDVFKRQSSQFAGASKVLYLWGTSSSVPLEYFVSKCDYNHKTAFTNRFGYTQYTEVTMELVLDEQAPIYKVEEMFRKLDSFGGGAQGNVGDVLGKANKTIRLGKGKIRSGF